MSPRGIIYLSQTGRDASPRYHDSTKRVEKHFSKKMKKVFDIDFQP